MSLIKKRINNQTTLILSCHAKERQNKLKYIYFNTKALFADVCILFPQENSNRKMKIMGFFIRMKIKKKIKGENSKHISKTGLTLIKRIF